MNQSRKRLFIGFPVEVVSSLSAAIKRTKINAQQKNMEVYWVPEANYHVTLSFLGNTSLERIPAIENILQEIAATNPKVSTSLKGLGAFPHERQMRVLWVGVRKSRAIAGLQQRLQDGLLEAGFELEDRDYHPHLTIGRLRKARSGTDLLSPYVRTSFGDIDIPSIVLYESVLHGPTPVYLPLGKYELTGQAVEETEAF